jgi:hypothetical protein
MKLRKIIAIARHRNGVQGAPFDAVLFRDGTGLKLGILFEAEHHCSVLDVAMLAAGDIAFGSNSWRGDDYEPGLRKAVEQHHQSNL